MKAAATLAAVVLLLSGCSVSKEGGAAAITRLPDATLQPFGSGQPVDLSTLRGPMVINLWASWCGPCREELPRYEAFSKKYAGKVAVLGVDWQDTRTDEAQALIRRTGVTYPLASDPKGTLPNKYLPKLILIDSRGRVAYQEYVKITSVTQLETLVAKHLGVSAP